MNLTDLLSGSVISSIAGQTGTSEKDTQNVLANALPALVGAMAQNASTEDGANSLAKALDDHTSSKGLASLLQNVDTEDGAKILTKILGGETETVRNAVAKKSGASKVDTSKILAMAAPLLLAALGGGAFAYIKFIKPKQGTKVSTDPDDYEFAAGMMTRMTAVPLSRWLAACWAAAIKSPVRATAATFLPAWRAAC